MLGREVCFIHYKKRITAEKPHKGSDCSANESENLQSWGLQRKPTAEGQQVHHFPRTSTSTVTSETPLFLDTSLYRVSNRTRQYYLHVPLSGHSESVCVSKHLNLLHVHEAGREWGSITSHKMNFPHCRLLTASQSTADMLIMQICCPSFWLEQCANTGHMHLLYALDCTL